MIMGDDVVDEANHRAWMQADFDRIADLPLNQVALAGSHNSGSYAIKSVFKKPSGDCPEEVLKYLKFPLVSHVVARWSKVILFKYVKTCVMSSSV